MRRAVVAELDDGLGKRQFDLLFANILAGTLEELAPRLMELLRPGGKLVLSGILDSQRERVLSAYDRLLDIEVHERGQWLMVAGTRL